MPSTLAVTSALDDVSKHGTLRYAVANAQNGDTILLTEAVADTGISLTQGELLLTQQNLTITSAAPPIAVTISGNHQSRVFEVAGGASITLANRSSPAATPRPAIPPTKVAAAALSSMSAPR